MLHCPQFLSGAEFAGGVWAALWVESGFPFVDARHF